MHKKEIMKLSGLVSREGYTLVPLQLYFKGSHVKVQVGLCRGKKLYDKRDSAAEKQANRDIDRQMKSKQYQD
jgi:SsrA-binding protein